MNYVGAFDILSGFWLSDNGILLGLKLTVWELFADSNWSKNHFDLYKCVKIDLMIYWHFLIFESMDFELEDFQP